MQMPQGLGQVTFFQPYGNDEDFIVWKKVRFFEREFQFFVAVSVLFIESAREAGEDNVTLDERIADLILPVLPGLESFRIEPDVQSILNQTLVQLVDDFPVTVCVDKEYIFLLYRSFHSL